MPTNKTIPAVALAALLVTLAACASTGATFGSGVGDAYLERPPYTAGAPMTMVGADSGRIGHLPIAFQRGAVQESMFDPRSGRGTPMDSLVTEMNAWLDGISVSERLEAGVDSAPSRSEPRVPPDVRFGCIPEYGAPGNDCAERGDSALVRGPQQMLLAVGRPSAAWTAWIGDAMRASHVDRVLVITLEVGNYLMKQEGLLGTKVVELGTGNRAQLPWLTSLETPVSVLQLTAALVDGAGKAIRIGAEGFYALRTRLVVSAIGGQEILGDGDVRAAGSFRREDLPGAPIAWQVALRELVGRVTGREVSTTASAPR
jgi:hypothetical protein